MVCDRTLMSPDCAMISDPSCGSFRPLIILSDTTEWYSARKLYRRVDGKPPVKNWTPATVTRSRHPRQAAAEGHVTVTAMPDQICQANKIFSHQLRFIYPAATAFYVSQVLVQFKPSAVDSLQLLGVLLTPGKYHQCCGSPISNLLPRKKRPQHTNSYF